MASCRVSKEDYIPGCGNEMPGCGNEMPGCGNEMPGCGNEMPGCGCSSNDNKLFRRSDSLLLIQHYIYKRHCINCNVQLHSMIAVRDINRYGLHFRQFMLMANTVTSLLL